MALIVKIVGLDRKGFRINSVSSPAGYRTVTSAHAVAVDLQDPQVQKVLKRNAYRVLTVADATPVT